jgi:hypothetical protein
MKLRQRQPSEKSPGHLRFVRTLQCVLCGDNTSVEAAHVSYADSHAGKWYEKSIAGKVSDRWTVPLCSKHHREQHSTDEWTWWQLQDRDPVKIAQALWIASGDVEEASRICEANRIVFE